jgi:hypothetical protein
MLVLNRTFLNLFLDYKKTKKKAAEELDDEEVYYKNQIFLEV